MDHTVLSEDCARMDQFMDTVIQCDILDDIFSGFVRNAVESEEYSQKEMQNGLVNLLKSVTSPESLNDVIKFYVDRTSGTVSYQQCKKLFSLLEVAIEKEIISVKTVCNCILLSENFSFKNEVFWVSSLNFIHHMINLVDYKGVRDILGVLLSNIQLIPLKWSTISCKQVNALYALIEYILDRDAALLPAYFALDEIQKKGAHQNGHWKFSKLISAFVDSFRPVAKIVSISGRPKILPLMGHSLWLNVIKLDFITAKYKMKGLLPYDREACEPQTSLLQFIMEQNNSRDTIVSLLLLNKAKSHCIVLEHLLLDIFTKAINKCANIKSENGNFESFVLNDTENEINQIVNFWQHISSTLLYFEVHFQCLQLSIFLNALYQNIVKYSKKNSHQKLVRSREFLMWTITQLLPIFISKNTIANLFPIFNLIEFLYQERDPLPVPDLNKLNCVYIFSGASAWLLLSKKAEMDQAKYRPPPIALMLHIEFLKETIKKSCSGGNNAAPNDFVIISLCNSFLQTSNEESYQKSFRLFIENILNKQTSNMHLPIPIQQLDALTVQSKNNLLNHIMSYFHNLAQSKSMHSLPAGIVETYSRLMNCPEMEIFECFKSFINKVLPSFSANQSYLYTLLELFSYRLHHVNCAYRIQLLRTLQSASNHSNHIQLYTCIENITLKIILGFNSAEFLTYHNLLTPYRGSAGGANGAGGANEHISFLPPDSEELSKIFILTLARAHHVTGSETLSTAWVQDVINGLKSNLNVALSWPEFTLKCFPSAMSNKFFQENSKPRESLKENLMKMVEEEYRKWKSMSEDEIEKLFATSPEGPHRSLFFCVLYKLMLDNEPISIVAYKILDSLPPYNQSILLRTFADYLVYEFANIGGNRVNKCLETLSDFVWKCCLVSFDRLLLCLALRNFEGNEAQVCFFIILKLLVNNQEFSKRVSEFVKENSPEHWKQSNGFEKQILFQRKYPEKYYFDNIREGGQPTNSSNLSVMFNNICLRVLPVIDVIIHRLIELPASPTIAVDPILEKYGSLYKFHEQPITFLYNTLHYYGNTLRGKPGVKRKLVFSIVKAFKDIRPRNWAVTDKFLNYCQKNADEEWNVGPDYYRDLIGRLVDTLSGREKCPFPPTDYRFNEFSNVALHALYVTCVEILALPNDPVDIANSIINVVVNNHRNLPRQDIELWINATALILTALPDIYSNVINDRIIEFLSNPQSLTDKNLFNLVDFNTSHNFMNEPEISYLIALSHAYWSQGNIGQLCALNLFIKDRIKPIIQTEEQFLFVCLLVGPFLQRFLTERTRCMMECAVELYEMLEIIDRKCSKLKHLDKICDLLYHIKYQLTGDLIKKGVEKPIQNMRPELCKKLRFI